MKRLKLQETSNILVSRNLPFTPNVHDVFFVNTGRASIVNFFFQHHYDEISRCFPDYTLLYGPRMDKGVVNEDTIRYMFPYRKSKEPVVLDEFDTSIFLQYLEEGDISGPSLLHYRPYSPEHECYGKNYYFSVAKLNTNLLGGLYKQVFAYFQALSTIPIYYGEACAQVCMCPADISREEALRENADLQFESSSKKLLKEAEERILELRRRGVQLDRLRALIDEKPLLSRLVVTRDYKIMLPDYGDVEIEMPPLPKAVFMLFLRHQEGIVFKELSDFYPELLSIYRQISPRIEDEAIRQSIRDLTDPTKNSINEKCARIREAFLLKIDDAYARHYYVTGKRGMPKRIILPHNMIEIR